MPVTASTRARRPAPSAPTSSPAASITGPISTIGSSLATAALALTDQAPATTHHSHMPAAPSRGSARPRPSRQPPWASISGSRPHNPAAAARVRSKGSAASSGIVLSAPANCSSAANTPARPARVGAAPITRQVRQRAVQRAVQGAAQKAPGRANQETAQKASGRAGQVAARKTSGRVAQEAAGRATDRAAQKAMGQARPPRPAPVAEPGRQQA